MKVAAVLVLAFATMSEHAIAQLHDYGFTNAKVRTDYNSQTEGTSSNPITFVSPCLFPAPTWCGNSPTVFSATNSFAQNVAGYPQSNYWVLDFNNEPAYNRGGETTNNPGPPNQSVARSAPGYGLMGFTAIKDSFPGEPFYRAHLVLNGFWPNPNGDAIPYMAVGVEQNRGNNGLAPGVLNYAPGNKRAQFKARIWDLEPPTQVGRTPTLALYFTAKSAWGGKARGFQLTLYHHIIENSWLTPSPDFTKKWKWNWPMQESFYHPGVEWAFIDAEDVQYFCGFSVPRLTAEGQQFAYDINLQSMFQCLSNNNAWDTPMPGGVLAITGLHWAVEMSGDDGVIWASVHDMKMVQ